MTRVIPGTHKYRKLEENALTTWYMGLFGLISEVVKLWMFQVGCELGMFLFIPAPKVEKQVALQCIH